MGNDVCAAHPLKTAKDLLFLLHSVHYERVDDLITDVLASEPGSVVVKDVNFNLDLTMKPERIVELEEKYLDEEE